MLIEYWMTRDVITGTPEMSMMKAEKLMKDKKIARLPVLDDQGKLVGIVSDRDIKEASPSKATTLDIHELYYLLSELKLKDIMTKQVITVRPDETIEHAAEIMLDHTIGGMPVVDELNRLVGIITDADIFKVLVRITGVKEGGVEVGVRLSTKPGGLVPFIDFLKDNGARMMSLLTSCEPGEPDVRDVYVRIRTMEKSAQNALEQELRRKFTVLYWIQE